MEGLSAFGGARKDPKITTGRYPTTPLPIDAKFWAPDLLDSGLAHGKLGTYLGPTTGVGGMSKKAKCRQDTTDTHARARARIEIIAFSLVEGRTLLLPGVPACLMVCLTGRGPFRWQSVLRSLTGAHLAHVAHARA
jgi:hypothetical protein